MSGTNPYNIKSPQPVYTQYAPDIDPFYYTNGNYPTGDETYWIWENQYVPIEHIVNINGVATVVGKHVYSRSKVDINGRYTIPIRMTGEKGDKGDAGTIYSYTPENINNKSIDGTLSGNSTTLYPSQSAVKTYIDNTGFKSPVNYITELPTSGNILKDIRFVNQNKTLYYWNGSMWIKYGTSSALNSYIGKWNATTNVPTLVSGVGTAGYWYEVGTAGNTTIDGYTNWSVDDYIWFDTSVTPSTWRKIDNSNPSSMMLGSASRIPFMNTTGDNFTYSSLFKFSQGNLQFQKWAALTDGVTAGVFYKANGSTIWMTYDTTNQALGIGKIKPLADSTTAIQITKADAITPFITLDTTNTRLGYNTIPSTFLHIKVPTYLNAIYFENGSGTSTGGRRDYIHSNGEGSTVLSGCSIQSWFGSVPYAVNCDTNKGIIESKVCGATAGETFITWGFSEAVGANQIVKYGMTLLGTGELTVGNSILPEEVLHLSTAIDGARTFCKFSNTVQTGNGASEGLNVGIDSVGHGDIRHYNYKDITIATDNTDRMKFKANGNITILGLGNYTNDVDAAAGGVIVNGLYRNGSVLMIRVS